MFALVAPDVAGAQISGVRRSPEARVDDLFVPYNRIDAPGCVVGVVRDGRLEYARGYGMADLENNVPLSPTTAFYIASVAKQFTAYSALLLASEGKLSLDDDVRRWIPEVPDFGARITLRHLLHHTSGLRDYFGLFALRGWRFDEPITEREFLDLVSRQRMLNFEPGMRHLYSNTGYVLLALAVQRASGASLREFAATRIFRPLGMGASTFRDDHRMMIRGRGSAYDVVQGSFKRSEPSFDLVGDGGMFSTVEDLARWERNFFSGQVGGRGMVQTALNRGVLATGDTILYAAGLSHGIYRGVSTIGHSGSYGGYRADVLRIPSFRFATIVLCNRSDANPSRYAQLIADIYLSKEFARAEQQMNSADRLAAEEPIDTSVFRRLSGTYWDEEAESLMRVTAADGRIAIAAGGVSTILAPRGSFSFVSPTSGTRYEFDIAGGNGRPRVTVFRWGLPPVTQTAIDSTSPSPATLAQFSGSYYSPELEINAGVRFANGRISLTWHRSPEAPLAPLFGRTFMAGGGLIVRFAGDGRSLTVSNGRTQRVEFFRVGEETVLRE